MCNAGMTISIKKKWCIIYCIFRNRMHKFYTQTFTHSDSLPGGDEIKNLQWSKALMCVFPTPNQIPPLLMKMKLNVILNASDSPTWLKCQALQVGSNIAGK